MTEARVPAVRERSEPAERRRAARRLPLRVYGAALLVLFALTAATSVAVVAGLEDRNATRSAQRDAQFSASLAAAGVSTAVTLLQSTVARTAATPGIGAAFDQPACALSLDAIGPFSTTRLDLVRTDGSVVCSSVRVPGGSTYAGAPWLADMTKPTPLAVPVRDPRTGVVSAISTVPVVGRGLVVGFVDLTVLGPALATRYSGPQALEFLIVAADGRTILARSIDPARWIGSSLDGTAFAQDAGMADRPDLDGMARIYASAPVAGAGWLLYAGADRDAALVPARDLFRQHVGITLAGMLVLLVGTLLIYRSVMAPLVRLSTAMGHGTSGLVRGSLQPSGPAEIARLGERFNALIAAVRSEIAETARAEEAAHVSEANYRLLFAGNPQPLFVYDLDTLAFLEVNDAAISRYGYSREEFRSRTVAEVVSPDALPGLASVKNNPDLHRSGPWRHRTKDGGWIDVELTSLRLAYDNHDARLVVVEDLTERTRLERQLQQTQRLETVGQLAGGIAHDFNNLLAVILNYADFVADGLPEGPLRGDVEEIRRAATRAAALTRQLLIFARRDVVHREVLDLNAVIGGVESMLRRTIGEDIALVQSLAGDLPSVRADAGQLEQVFLNLAVNARDAMPRGGKLVVETSVVDLDDEYAAGHANVAPGRYVRLSVSDTGIGMSSEVAARAFEPFFTTKPAGQGTGLGLATVYGIIAQAGGNIGIYSEPSLGTRVSIHLPAVDAQPTAAATLSDAALPSGDGATVLIVEDESAVLLAAARILSASGYQVITRSDASDALAVLGDLSTRVDLLATDVVMPGMSGIELATDARRVRPGLPVVYMTGYSREVAADRGALPAGSDMVQKPFTRRDLLGAIGGALARTKPA